MASPSTGQLYGLADTEGAALELHELYQRILAPLSLFPASFTRVKSSFPSERPSAVPSVHSAVPVPISLTALLQMVKARLEPGPQWAHVPSRDRQVFREVILLEVKHIFKDVQHSLYDPAFSAQTNRELYQQLVVYIGLVCQHLFLHYLRVMDHRHQLGIFTDCANLTRFSAQLSLDCSSLLNVAAVRHRLVMEMKTPQNRPPESPTKPLSPQGQSRTRNLGCRLGFTISYFIRLTRPHVPTLKQKMAKDIKELEELPLLDMDKIKQLNLPRPEKSAFLGQMTCAAITTPCPRATASKDQTKLHRAKRATSTILKRSQSLPNMRVGQLLADELGICIQHRPLSPDLPCHYESTEDGEFGGTIGLAEDLRRLVQGSVLKTSPWKGEQDDDLELPPLIKALTWRKANEVRQEQLQRMQSSLQKEESSERQRRDTIISAPASHPQAATVNFAVHDKLVVKAADLQVSERSYVEAMAMEKCPPIYNHLLGEINAATIKSLDANLSTGEEVREMYKELKGTIPKDYLKFDLGPLTEPDAANIDLSVCFASSTLARKKCERIINEKLSKILPTGPYSPEEVVDTPMTPNLPFKRKKAKKEFASWLKWWKASFNTDNYLKYLSTKEADYLPVIFHLYDFGEAEQLQWMQPVLDQAEIKEQEKVKKEVIKEATKIQSTKEEFQAGKWNTNSVMMGGLGAFLSCDHKDEDLRVLQRRLERLWTVLHFSERERLDMAIKYSSNQYYLLLPDMLQAWEEAARFIQDRELLLAEMERFEQTASDPNRLFDREPQSFMLRIEESKTRSRQRAELGQFDAELYVILNHIKKTFDDTVTFRGRPYLEKMEWDTVEMLYWLQQERRASALWRGVKKGGQRRKLPPIYVPLTTGQDNRRKGILFSPVPPSAKDREAVSLHLSQIENLRALTLRFKEHTV
ncbi:coiled-coil domain-containing protein 87 [Elgaria multicarinata webbii]|uniref:coiled-coil domain-containing protein 87 n=1 Tax=Elgaria multicarinata webbii TaxID=159646 RepID=UPI002FCCE24C